MSQNTLPQEQNNNKHNKYSGKVMGQISLLLAPTRLGRNSSFEEEKKWKGV